MNYIPRRFLFLLVLGGIVINATGLLNEILEPDGALYAAISKRMALTSDWINLYSNGTDWLDKPHLPFWLAAVSMKCLGITALAYKLPAFLCFLTGVYYMYQLACILYNKDTALLAVVIYMTALHTLLANFDVRAEACLTAFIIAAIYHLYRASGPQWWIQVLAAAFYCALAVMTKGIFVLITIGGGFVAWWLFTGQWKQLFRLRWWLVLMLILLFILPELYCLYTQFDLHPEKIVFGHTGVSGIRFFFWDSQFGRFFNNGPIHGQGDPFFFLHTTAWAFLPWALLLYIAVVQLFRRKEKGVKERWVIWGSAGISFLLFSLSRFQLPHYIVIVFPHFAMITAAYLMAIRSQKALRQVNIVQHVLFGVLVLLLGTLLVISRLVNPVAAGGLVIVITIIALVCFRQASLQGLTGRSFLFTVLLFLFLNTLFYPALLRYQAGMEAGKSLQAVTPAAHAVLFRCAVYSFEYYAPGLVQYVQTAGELDSLCQVSGPLMVFLPEQEWQLLQHSPLKVHTVQRFNNFHVSQLTGEFLNGFTREGVLEHYILASVSIKK
jgi:4-amino-4-deoxy-L-arabinose transferase-like glycosyltransferase